MNHSRRTKRGILQIGNKNIFIYEGINIVGRSMQAVVILRDLVASQQHAIFTIINDAHYISDVNSTNGTKLNGTNLSPFQMYLLEEGSEIEFTPQFIGKYKKIHDKNSSQIYTPQYESQNTQTEEGFYEASTQVEMVDKTKAMFNDDMDDDLSKMVIDTQMINDSMIGKNKPAAPEESIHEAETQLMVNVPSINEAPTQLVTKRCSVVSAFVDSQFFAGNTQHVEIAMEPSGDKLDLNGDAPNSIDEESRNIPTNEIGPETSTTQPLPLTNVLENEITEEIVKAVPQSSQLATDLTEEESCSNEPGECSEKLRKINESISAQSDKADSQAQTQNSTENSLNLKLSLTQDKDNDNGNNSNVSVGLKSGMTQSTLELLNEFAKSRKEKSITGANSDEEVLEESEILPNDGYGSDESIDFLAGMGNSTLETINAYARILNERNKIENSEKEAIAESAKILPESDDEGIVKQKVRSSVRRSRFIISDSEDSAGEEVETKITEPKTIENSVLSDCEDSFVARKSIGNASLDYIPATQDASFSRTSDVAFKLGLSRVQELCESGDISALQISTTEKDESVINDSVVGEKVNMPNESLHDTPRKSFDNESQEFVVQKANSNVVRDTESTDFLVPTQPICKRTRSSVGLNSSDLIPATQDVCDDVDFDAPTQPILKTKPGVVQNGMVDEDVDFSAPTQPIIASECNALTFDIESEVFCMPTQPVAEFAKSKKGSRNSCNTSKLTQSENFDFDAPTQKLCDNVFDAATQKLKMCDNVSNAETQKLNDVDFDAPTQQLEAQALCTEQEKDDIDFEAPTQPIIQPAKVVPVPHIEEETDFESPTQPIMRNDNDCAINEPHQVMKRVQEIESQLEVLFETQNVTLSTADSSRPTNPLASLIETCSTQDVISSLTGGGTKRSSDEFDVNGQSKRAKTTATPKAKTTSKRKSIDTPELDNSRKSSIKDMDVTNANKNKSILDFFGKASSTMIENSINGKVSSKLSMIKKQIATDVLDSVSNVEVECLADTIPMVAMDSTDNFKHTQVVEDQTMTADKTLDITAARKKKRKLLDEETMCSMPTPEPVKTIDLTDDDKNEMKSTETPKACIKKTKTTAKTNTTKRNTRQTRGSVRFEESSDDSDEECKVATKKTRGRPPKNVRASTRAKKSVNYKENHEKSKSTRSHQNNSSDSEKEDKRIIITVPEKQIKLVITDEEDLKKKEIKSDIKKVSRSSKIKEEVTMSPERSKRVTKPKVIFTMLDDPKLKQIVRSLGGSIVEKIAQSTVLVTEKVQRTLKLLSAIGRSIPICSPEWLMECKKAHAFLDPWDYLIKDPDAEKMWKFKIGQTLEMSKRSKIFAGIQFLLVTTLSVDVIKGGIEANGGKVVTRKPANDNFIVVGDAAHQSKYATYLKSKVKVVSAEAILVGILRQEIAFDEFALS
ncbi:uncharacterized protein [Atheta coriaria]|uniref:uncharacterized protein n=1 Tax=Dalotia coriaria TaxID=877792 RepID=UPI0031F46843